MLINQLTNWLLSISAVCWSSYRGWHALQNYNCQVISVFSVIRAISVSMFWLLYWWKYTFFAYTQPLWFSSTQVLRTLKNWSVGILSWRLGPQLQIRTHAFYAFGISPALFTLNCTQIYILRRETGKNWVGWSAVLAAQPEKKVESGLVAHCCVIFLCCLAGEIYIDKDDSSSWATD